MIDYDLIDEQYDELPSRERIPKSNKPVGSLTDNVKKQKPIRDSAHKRLHEFVEKGY